MNNFDERNNGWQYSENAQTNGEKNAQAYNMQQGDMQNARQFVQPNGQQYGQYAQPNNGQYDGGNNDGQADILRREYERGFRDGVRRTREQYNSTYTGKPKEIYRTMDGFGKALTSCILGLYTMGAVLRTSFESFVIILPMIVLSVVLGVQSIMLFAERAKENRTPPIPALVLGIVGVSSTLFTLFNIISSCGR